MTKFQNLIWIRDLKHFSHTHTKKKKVFKTQTKKKEKQQNKTKQNNNNNNNNKKRCFPTSETCFLVQIQTANSSTKIDIKTHKKERKKKEEKNTDKIIMK